MLHVQLTLSNWLSTEEPLEVGADYKLGGSLASDDLYLLDLRSGEN